MVNSSSSASTNRCTVPSSRWRRRSVTFSNTSILILINKQQLSSNTKKSLYCTEEDIATFKRNTHLHARLVQESIARGIVPPIESIIGNEKLLTPYIANQYVARRNKLKRGVLKVSRWQEANRYRKPTSRSRDYADMDFLACVSSKHSAWARKKAKTAALVLQQDLEKERQQEERMFQTCQDYTMCMPASSSSASSAHQDTTGQLQTIPEEQGRRVSVSPVMGMEIDGTLSRIRI